MLLTEVYTLTLGLRLLGGVAAALTFLLLRTFDAFPFWLVRGRNRSLRHLRYEGTLALRDRI